MKICKFCKEEIHEDASKCPKCQSFQSKFLNPLTVSILPLLLMMVFFIPWTMSVTSRSDKAKFTDHKSNIELVVLKTEILKKEAEGKDDLLNILVELDNKTDIEWSHAYYEIVFETPAGELINIEKEVSRNLSLHPNSKAKSSIKIATHNEFEDAAIKVSLVDMKESYSY